MTAKTLQQAESLVIERIHSAGGAAIAKHLGVSEATVTRMKNEQLGNWIAMLDYLGLKVVPKEMPYYDPKTISALAHFAKKAMDQMESSFPLEASW